MQNTPDRGPGIRGEPTPDPAAPRKPGSRTTAAGSEFLEALGSDLAALAAHLRGRLAAAPRWPARRALPAGPGSTAPGRARTTGRSVRRLVLGAAIAATGVVLAVSCAMLWAVLGLPIDRTTSEPEKPTLVLTAANGEPLGRAGPLTEAAVPLQDFSPTLIKAVLSTEDRRFYSHAGIDPVGILRAAHANRVAGQITEGGSTITQQLVKREYLNDDRSYVRKLREALMAIWLEAHLSKDQILTRYLNHVYLGDGAFGMAAAARLYFDKTPGDLTLPEAAMLAGLIQAPSAFDPLRHLAAAQARAATVLDAMVANHAIDAPAAAAAKADPATVKSSSRLTPAASWFADWVAKGAAPLAGSRTGIVRVRTTLVPGLQDLAQRVLDDALAQQGRRLGVSQGALVVMRPDGAVLAMVGGRDYRRSQFNRATDANRQPGSAFKLFVYLAALRQGYAPQDTVDAGPVDIKGWQPANFDDEHYGRITLAEAFARSVNTAAVRLAMKVGLGNVVDAARDLGITEPLPKVPSLALGSVGVSLVDLTGAFASVRADRMKVRPWGVAAIGAADGSRMLATVPPLASGQSLGPYQKPLVELLQGVVQHGTGRAAALDGFAAGKTGTSQDYRDAWFVGFDDALVVGVWVGNDDDSPMKRVVGGGLPAEIWKAFMTRATPVLEQQGTPVATDAAQPEDAAAVDDQGTEGSTGQPVAGFCDYQACSSTYHSFRASDCTYQPYDGGPRQLCEKGAPPPSSERVSAADEPSGAAPSGAAPSGAGASGATPSGAAPSGAAPSGAMAEASPPTQCNVAACAAHYSSFRASDCTYQPYDGGPRQLCEK
jgi:1A family penicillin-binding protein